MLAATLVHEIKNPLALVRANLDYMELCDTEKRYSKSYSVIKTQLEKTDGIIHDFVGLLQGAGTEDAPVDVLAVLEGVISDYSSQPAPREVGFALELEPGLIVHGNEKLLGIVFSNAVKNAIEAGAGRITVRGGATGERVCFTVADNGCGLTAQTLEHLNDGGGYTTKKYGNGLGVLMSRRIINGCGGSYSIGNAEGGGCEVRIELPAEHTE